MSDVIYYQLGPNDPVVVSADLTPTQGSGDTFTDWIEPPPGKQVSVGITGLEDTIVTIQRRRASNPEKIFDVASIATAGGDQVISGDEAGMQYRIGILNANRGGEVGIYVELSSNRS